MRLAVRHWAGRDRGPRPRCRRLRRRGRKGAHLPEGLPVVVDGTDAVEVGRPGLQSRIVEDGRRGGPTRAASHSYRGRRCRRSRPRCRSRQSAWTAAREPRRRAGAGDVTVPAHRRRRRRRRTDQPAGRCAGRIRGEGPRWVDGEVVDRGTVVVPAVAAEVDVVARLLFVAEATREDLGGLVEVQRGEYVGTVVRSEQT